MAPLHSVRSVNRRIAEASSSSGTLPRASPKTAKTPRKSGSSSHSALKRSTPAKPTGSLRKSGVRFTDEDDVREIEPRTPKEQAFLWPLVFPSQEELTDACKLRAGYTLHGDRGVLSLPKHIELKLNDRKAREEVQEAYVNQVFTQVFEHLLHEQTTGRAVKDWNRVEECINKLSERYFLLYYKGIEQTEYAVDLEAWYLETEAPPSLEHFGAE
ncbi:hypothetical protein FRB90_009062, partial [Tulasnella sp. 427]